MSRVLFVLTLCHCVELLHVTLCHCVIVSNYNVEKLHVTSHWGTFKQARVNEGLRNFLAQIFTSLNHYKDDKPKVTKLKEEVAILSKLHQEKEEETMLANLRASQKLRAATVKAKGEAQAEKKLQASDEKMAKKAKTK